MPILTRMREADFIFRRRILIENHSQDGQYWIQVDLEDIQHAMHLRLYYRNGIITDILGDILRAPFDTCAGATQPIRQLIGTSLDATTKQLRETSHPRGNCTHFYDMTMLALAHYPRPSASRRYDVTVPNSLTEPAWASIECNGELVHRWRIAIGEHFGGTLVEPQALRGRPVFRGFFEWISQELSAEEQEAALMLQKGYLVSPSRNHNHDFSTGRAARVDTGNIGACYSYSSPQVETAIRVEGSIRDFSDLPEQLLKFA